MPYQAHLQEARGILAHQGGKPRPAARLVALILLLALLPLRLHAALCEPAELDIVAAPALDDPAAIPLQGWEPVGLPDYWQQRWPQADTVWYRVRWNPGCGSTANTALALSQLTMAGEIRINDSLLWRDASLEEPFSRSWNMPRYWLLPEAALQPAGNTLWIRVTGMPQDRLGLGRLVLGDPAEVLAVHERNRWLQRHVFTLSLAISLALGLLFLALWCVRRMEVAFGWFAQASLLWAVFAATMLATSTWPFRDSSDWNRFAGTIFLGYCFSFCRFTWAFGGQALPRMSKSLTVLTAVACLVLWLLPDAWLSLGLVIVIPTYAVIFLGNCLQFQWHARHKRERHIVLLALCLLVFLLIGLHDLLVVLTVLPGSILLAPFASIAAMLFMFLIIADRFARDFDRIEHYNSDLQAAVEATRTELTRTLQREHELQSSNIRLNERLRLSHDLHDSLGGSLVRSIATVEQSDSSLDNRRFLSMLKELRDDLRQIIDSTSQSGQARDAPPVEWIAPLRQRFAQLFDELGLTSRWELPALWPVPLGSTQRIDLARCIEETLTNVLKHSRATAVSVIMQATPGGGMLLRILDNGIGFDDAARENAGVGMSSMRARVQRIGGTLDIRSEAGETCVEITVEDSQPGIDRVFAGGSL